MDKEQIYEGEDAIKAQVSSLCQQIETKAKHIIHIGMPEKILSLNKLSEVILKIQTTIVSYRIYILNMLFPTKLWMNFNIKELPDLEKTMDEIRNGVWGVQNNSDIEVGNKKRKISEISSTKPISVIINLFNSPIYQNNI